MRMKYFLSSAAFLLLVACGDPGAEEAPEETMEETATTAEEPTMEPGDDDWTVLFNGEDFTGWHRYGGEEAGSAWTIDDGAIYFDPTAKGDDGSGGGDLTTDESYANYELELEWKIGECGNSGIIYNVVESEEYPQPWRTGPEMQVLDNSCHPDAKIETHRAGDLYDMIKGQPENVKPAGEWNSVRLVVADGEVQHWQNGEMLLSYQNKGPEWESMIADSKFKDFDGFGQSTSGKISLQDHGDPVWYRNIRIRELDSK